MFRRIILDNGLRLIISPMPHTRSVCATFFIGSGSRYEEDDEAGISHFVEHLCFKGTKKRPTSKEISESVEGVGGMMNGGTDKELTTYWCKVASNHLQLALDVLSDILLNSRLDSEEIERERKIILEEISMVRDLPQYRVDTLVDELLWRGQPLGRDVAGSKKTVKGLKRERILEYMRHHYLPQNTVLSIAGDLKEDKVIKLVSSYLEKWRGNHASEFRRTIESQRKPKIKIETRDIEQAHLCFGFRGVSNSHPDRFGFNLLNAILGEGMSSRLFINIRDRLGLAYDVHSYINHYRDTGSLIIYAGVAPCQVKPVIQAVIDEIRKLKEKIPASEFTKVKEYIKGRLILGMEDSHTTAGWYGAQEILTGRILSINQAIKKIEAIDVTELIRIARESLVSQKLNLAIVGPLSKDESLEELLVF